MTPRVPANPDADSPFQEVPEAQTTRALFQINSAKLYVPVVTLSMIIFRKYKASKARI